MPKRTDIIWKDVPGFEGLYQASNNGRIKSSEKELKVYTHKKYPQVCLYKRNRSCWKQLNQLVASTFIANPNGYKGVRHKDGNFSNCSADNLEWVSKGYSKIKFSTSELKNRARERNLRRQYGIGISDYEQILHRQQGCCAVCLKPASSFSKRLAVDHDHKTGEIFGLLCNFCNHRFIGRTRDPEKFKRAGRYLEKGTGLYVPEPRPKRKRKKKR